MGNPQNLANTAWAFATAGHEACDLFDALAHEAAGRVRQFNPQELANTAWSMAVLDVANADVLFCSQDFVGWCTDLTCLYEQRELSQFHQWQLWRDERCAVTWPTLSTSLAARCRAEF